MPRRTLTPLNQAMEALNKIIRKARVHLYKPIQIAEILYHHRVEGNFDLSDPQSYRNDSKKWRNAITAELLGTKSSSSSVYQDNLFDDNAMPPKYLKVLAAENERSGGDIEAYIYGCFYKRHSQLTKALRYCSTSTPADFSVDRFIDSFWKEPGLRRSVDKVYEIVVYALFSTLVDALDLKVEVSIDEKAYPLLREFEDFSQKVMCLDTRHTTHLQEARVFRVGVTNAADRGLDMYSNWGPAIQIKHLSLDAKLAEEIVTRVASDKIVIVCKSAERGIILSLLTQIGWRDRIQSIVTQENLADWYEKALRGRYAHQLAEPLLQTLAEEILQEFPSVGETPKLIAERGYERMPSYEAKSLKF